MVHEQRGQARGGSERVKGQGLVLWAGKGEAGVQLLQQVAAQAQALGILNRAEAGDLAMVGLPLSFDGRRTPPLAPAPDIGADDEALRRKLGHAAARVAQQA